MPIVKKIKTEVGILGIWKLSESADDLGSLFQFSNQEKKEFKKFKAKRRKTEYLAVRLLLQDLLNKKQEIQYHKSGKPELKDIQKNVSISHSSDFVVVFISENRIGIDVENTQRNIEKVAVRFLHEEEFRQIQNLENPQTATILYWSAKEAIFKCAEEKGVQFNKQIFIPTFEIKSEGQFTGTLTTNSTTTNYKLWYLFYENNVIAYCVERELLT